MIFGEALKAQRERAGMTQAELAEKAGISLRTIQSWEQGYRSPVSPDFFKLVQALDVPADTFAVIADEAGARRAERPKRPRKPPKGK